MNRLARRALSRFAKASDPGAIRRLMVAQSHAERAVTAHQLWRRRAPAPIIRAAIEIAWGSDGSVVRGVFGNAMERAIREAQFPVDHIPPRVTVWRGGHGDFTFVADGISWTMNRDVACWYCCRPVDAPIDEVAQFGSRGRGAYFVVRREVERSSITMHLNHHGQDEVVIFARELPGAATIDGTPSDWLEGFRRYERGRA